MLFQRSCAKADNSPGGHSCTSTSRTSSTTSTTRSSSGSHFQFSVFESEWLQNVNNVPKPFNRFLHTHAFSERYTEFEEDSCKKKDVVVRDRWVRLRMASKVEQRSDNVQQFASQAWFFSERCNQFKEDSCKANQLRIENA